MSAPNSKPIAIPASLHQRLKVLAAKLGVSLGELAAGKLQELIKDDDSDVQPQLHLEAVSRR